MPGTGAIPVYVINLDRSPQRLAHMTAQLGRLGVGFERIRAVEGRELHKDYVAKFAPMAASQIGCFLSHKLAWQKIGWGDAPYGIVLEDDIHIAPVFSEFTRSSEWVPRDAGVVKFETMLRQVTLQAEPQCIAFNSSIRQLLSFHPGTGGYLVSAAAAKHLLEVCADPNEPIDDAMFYVEDVWRGLPLTYQLDPALCIQDAFRKDQSQDPQLTSTMEIERHRPKSLGFRIRREARRIGRHLARIGAGIAVATRVRPSFQMRAVVPFGPQDIPAKRQIAMASKRVATQPRLATAARNQDK